MNKLSRKEQIKLRRESMQNGTPKKEEQKICKVCGSTDFVYDSQRSELSCRRCGCVIEENNLDMGPEYRAFDSEQRAKRTRVGAPMSLTISDKGLSTVIGQQNKDFNGRNIPQRNMAQINRLRKWNKRARISGTGERNLAIALGELDRQSSKLGLPRDVREDAALIYRKAAKNNLVRGRSIEGMVAASVYTAARRNGIPRTLDEVSDVSNVIKKQIGKNYRFLSKQLGIKLIPPSPADYVPRFASILKLSGKVESMAIDIVHESREKGLITGREPTGVAAATIYLASVLIGEKVTQRQIAETASVSEVTIRNRYKEFTEKLNLGISV